jgi:tripartite-type tricarboxylate transporter receptor subunit TctC
LPGWRSAFSTLARDNGFARDVVELALDHAHDNEVKFFNSGVETVGGSPDQFLAAVKTDMAKWGKIIKDAGIRAN